MNLWNDQVLKAIDLIRDSNTSYSGSESYRQEQYIVLYTEIMNWISGKFSRFRPTPQNPDPLLELANQEGHPLSTLKKRGFDITSSNVFIGENDAPARHRANALLAYERFKN